MQTLRAWWIRGLLDQRLLQAAVQRYRQGRQRRQKVEKGKKKKEEREEERKSERERDMNRCRTTSLPPSFVQSWRREQSNIGR